MGGLRIGVNALYLIPGGVGGTEIYLRHLLRAFAVIAPENQYLIFTNRETGSDLLPEHPSFLQVPQAVRAVNRPARILWEQFRLPSAAKGVDVLLNAGFTAPVFPPCPQVTVFQDLQHKRQPENFRWFDLPFWRLLLWAAAHRSERLVASSEQTRADLLRCYRIPESRIHVAPLGVDPAFFEIARRRAPQPYLLAVSTLHPHKNLDGLLRAYAQFRTKEPRFRLIVAGMRGFFTEELERLRTELQLGDSVEFTGWIPRESLYDLYAGAWAFFYPSRFEGFGLPVLEAMAAGVPLACSHIEPLHTIVGDAALQFDPNDPASMLDAMQRITSDEVLRARLAADGPRRAKLFQWETTARRTLDALQAAVDEAR